jgi:hypothetical protein
LHRQPLHAIAFVVLQTVLDAERHILHFVLSGILSVVGVEDGLGKQLSYGHRPSSRPEHVYGGYLAGTNY